MTRQITHVKKTSDGKITALANPGNYWSPIPVENVIQEIEYSINKYVVKNKDSEKIPLVVVNSFEDGKYLSSASSVNDLNELNNLPVWEDEKELKHK